MESEWRVTYNHMMGDTPYGVYRLRNRYEVDHSGNRETLSEWYATRKEAYNKAAELNELRCLR